MEPPSCAGDLQAALWEWRVCRADTGSIPQTLGSPFGFQEGLAADKSPSALCPCESQSLTAVMWALGSKNEAMKNHICSWCKWEIDQANQLPGEGQKRNVETVVGHFD